MDLNSFLHELETYGIGKRKLDNPLFSDDDPPKRFGIYDVDDEELCHDVVQTTCHIPGCTFEAATLLEFENHYNASHRYSCSTCKKVLPSPHLLDLHIQERHDSFFAVMAAKKPSYCCLIEECEVKFVNTQDRMEHCVKIHKLPKDFRFDQKPKTPKPRKCRMKEKGLENYQTSMEVDTNAKGKNIKFINNKHKSFAKNPGKKLTNNVKEVAATSSIDVCMEEIVDDFQNSHLCS